MTSEQINGHAVEAKRNPAGRWDAYVDGVKINDGIQATGFHRKSDAYDRAWGHVTWHMEPAKTEASNVVTLPHPNAPAAVVAVPRRFIVVDGNAYWIDRQTLMHAPLNAAGQIAWPDGGPVEAVSNEVADMIADRLRTTFTLIDIAQQEA